MTDLIDAYIRQRNLVARLERVARIGELWRSPEKVEVLGAYTLNKRREERSPLPGARRSAGGGLPLLGPEVEE